MNREAVNRARALIDAATPGPWEADTDACIHAPSRKVAVIAWIRSEPDENGATYPIDFGRDEDAEFIAAARTGWPNTLDALEEAVALLDANDAEMATIERIATKRGPAHRIDLANIALCATRVRLATRAFLDAYRAEQS